MGPPTGTRTPTKPDVTVSASTKSVLPGGTILYRISAWSTSPADGRIALTLTPSAKTPAFSPPVFTVGGGTGNPGSTSSDLILPAKQPAAPQVEAQVSVPKTALAGETIEFSATVSVANCSCSPLTATASAPAVTVAKAPASPSPTSSTKSGAGSSPGSTAGGSTAGGSAAGGPATTIPSASGTTSGLGADLPLGTTSGLGADLPLGTTSGLGAALPIGALPVVGSGVPAVTKNIPAGSAATLFPQIGPSSAPSSAPRTGRGANPGKNAGKDAVTMSSVIPISFTSSQFGSQIIGLIILLLGVVVAGTGISVRKVRAIGKPST